VVSARALAPLERLLALAEPLFGAETLGVFPKGRGAKAELADAQKLWDFEVEAVASRTEAEGTIYCVRGLRRTAKEG
jgi:16S rRNA (guanine527-N7)-methyltransferase